LKNVRYLLGYPVYVYMPERHSVFELAVRASVIIVC